MFSPSTKLAANATKDMAENDIKDSMNQTKRDARNTYDNAKNTYDNAKEEISDYANEAGRKVRGFVNAANDEFHYASDKITGEIRTNPIRSSAFALLAGFLLGVVFRR